MATVDLVLMQWNVGKGSPADLRRVLRDGLPDACTFNEFFGQRAMMDVLDNEGYDIVVSPLKGGESTPTAFFDDRLRIVREIDLPLLAAGAGPFIRKNKILSGARVRDRRANRPYIITGRHDPYRQMFPAQKRAAELAGRRTFDFLNDRPEHVLLFHGLDANRKPSKTMLPGGWRNSHLVDKRLVTHPPGWSPDQWLWRDHPHIELTDTWTYKFTKSDHFPYFAQYKIKVL